MVALDIERKSQIYNNSPYIFATARVHNGRVLIKHNTDSLFHFLCFCRTNQHSKTLQAVTTIVR
jgi:hypothetical protein